MHEKTFKIWSYILKQNIFLNFLKREFFEISYTNHVFLILRSVCFSVGL